MCDTVLVTGKFHIRNLWVRKAGKMKEKGGTGYEASTCLTLSPP